MLMIPAQGSWVPDDCILPSCEPKGLPLCWQGLRVSSWHWAIRTRMAPCCTMWKGIVALFHVFPMFSIESWHALFAPGENKLSSRLATFKKLYRLILSIKRIMREIIFVEGQTLWCNDCFNFLIGFLQKNLQRHKKFETKIRIVLMVSKIPFFKQSLKLFLKTVTFVTQGGQLVWSAPSVFVLRIEFWLQVFCGTCNYRMHCLRKDLL